MKRAGFVLPVVLVCGLLGISMVVTFQFISSSDYKQVGRLMRSVQAVALADLAGDEVAAKLQTIKWVQGEQRPAWITGLLNSLESDKSARALGDMSADCPVTAQQATKSGLVKVDSIVGSAGPFTVLPAGGIDQAFIYKEPLFGAGGATAQDIRGPMSVEVKISGVGGPLAFGQTYRRGQTLAITDTTPPGREFATMAYLPPFSADYAVQDLNKGGTYKLNPGAGRLMFRGPLVLFPEEADPPPAFSDKPHMGEADPIGAPAGAHPTYPDGKYIAGMATIPGPRELQHPASDAGAAGAEIPGVEGSVLDVKDDMASRRPGGEKSDAVLRTTPTPLSITLQTGLNSPCPDTYQHDMVLPAKTFTLGEVSPVLAKDLGGASPAFDTVDKEATAFFPPLAYFYAPLPKGQQKFQIMPVMPSMTGGGAYQTLKVAAGGTTATLAQPAAGAEGDRYTTEPVGSNQEGVGIVTAMGVAIADSKTYVNVTTLDVAKWLVQKYIDQMNDDRVLAAALCFSIPPKKKDIVKNNKASIATQVLTQLGVDPAVRFLLRRYKVEGGLTVAGSISASQLASQLSSKKGAIAPWGAYWHDNNFWRSGDVSAAAKDAMRSAMEDATIPLSGETAIESELNRLLPESGGSPLPQEDAAFPDASSKGKIVRDFLTDEWCKKLLAGTPAAGASDPGAALNALTAVASKARGFTEPRVGVKPRPQGAFGPYAGAAPAAFDKGDLPSLYPKGTMPSKQRDWEGMATRFYDTFADYYAAEQRGGVLELRGAVLLKECNTTQNVNYTGRGILIVCTTDGGAAAKLGGTFTPQGTGSWLTVVHRVKPSLVTGTPPALTLGSVFKGTVLAETGVKPAGGQLEITGSLITGLLNKGASNDGDTVTVSYNQDTVTALRDAWTVESTGEVTSADPEP